MRGLLLSSALVVLHACGSVSIPPTKSYSLRPEAPSLTSRALPQVLRVGRFDVSPHLESDRLLVRVGSNTLESYEYHLWAAPLGDLVAGAVEGALLRAGVFADIVANDAALDADWVLGGRVLAFELVEDGEHCGAWLNLALSLREAETGRLIERSLIERRVDCGTKEPAHAIAALEAALGASLQEFVGIVEDKHGRRSRPARNGSAGPRAITAPPK